MVEEESGRDCGRVQTMFLKVGDTVFLGYIFPKNKLPIKLMFWYVSTQFYDHYVIFHNGIQTACQKNAGHLIFNMVFIIWWFEKLCRDFSLVSSILKLNSYFSNISKANTTLHFVAILQGKIKCEENFLIYFTLKNK